MWALTVTRAAISASLPLSLQLKINSDAYVIHLNREESRGDEFMLRVKWLIAGYILLLANSESPKFAKYKPVVSYEIRPEILIMPTYSTDGEVCQIGVE